MKLEKKLNQTIILAFILIAISGCLNYSGSEETEAQAPGIKLTGSLDISEIVLVHSDKEILLSVPVTIQNPLNTELELSKVRYSIRLDDEVVYSGELSGVYKISPKRTLAIDVELDADDLKRHAFPSARLNIIGRGNDPGVILGVDFTSLIKTEDATHTSEPGHEQTFIVEESIYVIPMLTDEEVKEYEEDALKDLVLSTRKKFDLKIPQEQRDSLDTITRGLVEDSEAQEDAAYYSLGLVAIFEKDIDVATWAFSRASELQNENLIYLASLAWALNEQGRVEGEFYEDSIVILSRIKSQGISLAPVYSNLGYAANELQVSLLDEGLRTSKSGLHVSDLYDISIDSYTNAVKLNEINPGYHMGLGKVHLSSGDNDMASEEIAKAYVLDPSDSMGPSFIYLVSSASIDCRQIDCQCESYDVPSLEGRFEPETCNLEESDIKSSCEFGEYKTCPSPQGSYALILEPFSWSTPANFKVTFNPSGEITTELSDLVTEGPYSLAFRPSWKENARFKGYGFKDGIRQFRGEIDVSEGRIDFRSVEDGWVIKPLMGNDLAGLEYLLLENWITAEN